MGVYVDTGFNPFYSYQSTTITITTYLYSKQLQGFVVFEGTNKLEGVQRKTGGKAIRKKKGGSPCCVVKVLCLVKSKYGSSLESKVTKGSYHPSVKEVLDF
jgi:hypothetical protein